MAPHSSTLAWKILWTEEPGSLQCMGSLRVKHDWANSLSLFTFMHWRRKWHPTPVFLPGESQGRGSLVGCRLWGRTESDTTEVTLQQQQQHCQRQREPGKPACKRESSGTFWRKASIPWEHKWAPTGYLFQWLEWKEQGAMLQAVQGVGAKGMGEGRGEKRG